MKFPFRTLVLAFVVAACAVVARADLFQLVQVNVRTKDRVAVEGKWMTTREVSAEIKRLTKGDSRRILIQMYIPIGLNREAFKRVMDACRQAGASTFHIEYKS